ncbi:MAG TPA: T9SS type A sorting domain-containing protein [Chitinophagaceae bacterium]|nr:T9SS type A sorting domain-containing protein [Chitinophagaceae bacterium]
MKRLFKSISAVIIFQSFLNTLNAQCPGGWVNQGGSANDYDRANITVNDNSGNVYVSGQYTDTAVFSSDTIISSSYEDIFLAKYDANGNLTWIKSVGGYNIDFSSSLAIDNNNNIYMTGVNYGTAVFDTITLNNFSGPNAFVAKFDSAGNVQWAMAIGSTDWDEGGGIAVQNNNLYITGTFSLSVVMGSTTLTSLGQRDFYLAKLDLNGNYLWARSAGSIQIDAGGSLAVDALGNIFVTGIFYDDITIGTTTLINQGDFDMFLAKYDDAGNLLWAKSGGGNGDDFSSGLALDSNSNIYVSLSGSTTCMFGTITVSTYGDKDIMLAKYDSSGNVIWAQHAGGAMRDIGGKIVVADNNKIYQTGSFEGNVTFGTITLTLSGDDYIFLAEYDSTGNVNFVKHAGGTRNDAGNGVSCYNSNVYVCGNFSNTTSFDLNTLTADTNGGNAFVWKACNAIVGIDEQFELLNVTLYPNPFYDKLNIETSDNQSMEITLRDITSRKLLRQEFTNSLAINLEQLSKGIYIFEVRNKNGLCKKGKVVKD